MLKNKKIRTSSPVSHLFDLLPDEVIIDQILLKLPTESLLSLRCVCKCLRSLITSPSFVQLHTQQQLAAGHDNDLILLSTPTGGGVTDHIVISNYICKFSSQEVVKMHCPFPFTDIRDFGCKSRSQEVVKMHCLFPLTDIRDFGCKSRSQEVVKMHCPFPFTDIRDFGCKSRSQEIVKMPCPFPFTNIRASCNGLLYVHGRPIMKMYSWHTFDHSLSPGYMYVYTTLIKSTRRNGTIVPTDTIITRRISPSYIWNPCTKEYKELRPPPPSTLSKEDQQVLHFDDQWNDFAILSSSSICNSFGFCGFGYDCANDDYKVLHYEYLLSSESVSVPTAEFKVYTLRTGTWKNISDNPYRSLFFGNQWLKIGLFVNGALHWIMSSEVSSRCATKARIISFDIEKEVFTEVQKPPLLREHEYYGNLQTLQGCLCVCQFTHPYENYEVDIWMLKDYAVKDSWTKFLRVVSHGIRRRPHGVRRGLSIEYFKLLRYCQNGLIAMLMTDCRDLVLYHPFNHTAIIPAEKFEKDVKGSWEYQMNYRKSLVSLNSGTYTR